MLFSFFYAYLWGILKPGKCNIFLIWVSCLQSFLTFKNLATTNNSAFFSLKRHWIVDLTALKVHDSSKHHSPTMTQQLFTDHYWQKNNIRSEKISKNIQNIYLQCSFHFMLLSFTRTQKCDWYGGESSEYLMCSSYCRKHTRGWPFLMTEDVGGRGYDVWRGGLRAGPLAKCF